MAAITNNINGFCYDIESDGFLFESTRIWTIWLKDLSDPSKKLKINPFLDKDAKTKFIDFLKSYPERPFVVGHNILGFDQFLTRCLMGLEFKVGKKNGDEIEGYPVQFVDTYYWSMYLHPDRDGHSIEAFGERLGLEKIDFRQASIDAGIISASSPQGEEFKQHSELMDEYCQRDVDVNILVFNSLMAEHISLYKWQGDMPSHFKAGQKAFFLMSCQEYSGFKFDVVAGEALLLRIGEMMEEIRATVEPQLPARGLKKTEQKDYKLPAKPFKKDGSYSSHMEKFLEKHNAEVIDRNTIKVYGKEYQVIGGLELEISVPMEMANQEQMKDWFLRGTVKPEFEHLYDNIEWVGDD